MYIRQNIIINDRQSVVFARDSIVSEQKVSFVRMISIIFARKYYMRGDQNQQVF